MRLIGHVILGLETLALYIQWLSVKANAHHATGKTVSKTAKKWLIGRS